ncbi:MAG: Crp/Fnr family transcriptional regulator [Rhizobacter sp.]|nr:Crp/Fnr family transcriptional regulator [Ferruginibacter sp.]
MNSHLDKINDFTARLDIETLTALNAISVEKIFKKGNFLLRQDEVCKKSYWIEKGIARKYYLNDGKEITTELYFDNDIAVSFDSYCLQKPSREYIQALTDTTILQTDFGAFQTAKQQFPKLAKLDLMMTEYYAMWLEDRLFQFHTMDATHRYLKLIEDHPYIIQNIPLTFIASYLGISLETLSRIRAKK